MCEELKKKLKNPHPNHNAKRVYLTEIEIYKRQGNEFHQNIQEVETRGVAYKKPNGVGTFVLDYIKHDIVYDAEELHLFSDGCGGQNRNHAMVRILLSLVAEHYKRDTILYTSTRSFIPLKR
ncbi:hypothetical protein JTB14_030190 [Gonioctena quinquepunctata]|nr:hypothetical protein JTB14_030190 [Gonioctena quinquepunctata]